MKKILLLVSTISLSTIISTNIIACNTSNINKQNNKPIKQQFTAQQPPKNSNWKTLNNTFNDEFKINNNKFYVILVKQQKEDKYWKIIKFKNDNIYNPFGNVWNNGVKIKDIWYIVKSLYRWDGDGEPTTPTINSSTGEITDWNKKIES
jgi:hypothetical protein